MARLSLMLIFMVWLSWTPGPGADAARPDVEYFPPLFGALAILILGMGLWSRFMARRLSSRTLHRDVRRLNRLMRFTRTLIPVWFAAAVYFGHWPQAVLRLTAPLHNLPIESPAFLLGTLPPLLAWVALWWAVYPADKALREQNLLEFLENDLPLRYGPTFRQYFVANLRLQLLFLYLPVLCILAFRDVLSLGLHLAGTPMTDGTALLVSLLSMLPAILLSPLLLVRILPTQPLPPSPLRDHLQELCRQHGIKVTRILLWKTDSTIGNAAVMGILPRLRYLLVTDLLLETMPDEQILAVFAHELGHVVHHHLLRMGACAFAFIFATTGPAQTLRSIVDNYITLDEPYLSLLSLAIIAPLFFVVFGYVVRRLERQADVFAARSVLQLLPIAGSPAVPDATSVSPAVSTPDPIPAAISAAVSPTDSRSVSGESNPPPAPDLRNTPVPRQGAIVVCAALERIAAINNIAIRASEWLHGSIAWRMDFLRGLADDPRQTLRFDRSLRRLDAVIFTALAVCGAWTLWEFYR